MFFFSQEGGEIKTIIGCKKIRYILHALHAHNQVDLAQKKKHKFLCHRYNMRKNVLFFILGSCFQNVKGKI
jgi:hypothetical protein